MIQKMKKLHTKVQPDTTVQYFFATNDRLTELNPLLGKKISLEHTGNIFCLECERKIKKTFHQGYCFPCFQKLAKCDSCLMRTQLCHYHLGTCREPKWGEEHCLIPHTLYVANTSGAKVGVTRSYHRLQRWCDQGAVQALPILETNQRLDAGLLEVAASKIIKDRTNWQQMLKGQPEFLDLNEIANEILAHLPEEIEISECNDKETRLTYPVIEYPTKVKSLSFDKTPNISGILLGLKGQYMILDIGVLQIRKFSGYEVLLSS